jgi:uncharacterized protein YcaQ
MFIPNRRARHIFLQSHALSRWEQGDLVPLIDRLGFVQLDSIDTLARAHDMILFSRQPAYQTAHLKSLHEDHRALWEHWTHDASLIPMHAYPYWAHRFDNFRARLGERVSRAEMDSVLAHISEHGAVTTRDVGDTRSQPGWWNWSPSKTALEWLWRMGDLAVSGRKGFQKSYDLTARVIPAALRNTQVDRARVIDWAASTALNNLGFASPKEIAAYYDLIDISEAKAWLARTDVRHVQIEGADGGVKPAFSFAEVAAPEPAPILRLLSPFDPMLRDRARAEFLFGFRYRIEVFVPEQKRQFGYYVFPVLQGDQLIGRIDVKAHRDKGALIVRAFWPEAGVEMTAQRRRDLDIELHRLVPFARCARLGYAPSP